ncbi:hypothetical protein EES37_35080 [Streptomyces sp. ADI91-18]|uniref:hypothetical protein n=1 Tax=Streptomyces sp. ADI91-18 TaxID=1522755 RepID=UPI000F96D5E5|nr:hypothetical protein [Streptomyces sp. ADI91-18]RPK29230.1 hypothetical protein EES37_35080 [Streptomyces sp. ADI91-18]
MAADDQDGPGDAPSGESEDLPPARDNSAPRPIPEHKGGSWASENVPLIFLALIILVLMVVGLKSNGNVTCPGGASSCGYP